MRERRRAGDHQPAGTAVTVTENTGSHVDVTCNGGSDGTIVMNTATGGSGQWLHLLGWWHVSVQPDVQRIDGDHLHDDGEGQRGLRERRRAGDHQPADGGYRD